MISVKRRKNHNMGECPISLIKMTITKRKRGQLKQCYKCKKWFHKKSLELWIKEKKNCPMCRIYMNF